MKRFRKWRENRIVTCSVCGGKFRNCDTWKVKGRGLMCGRCYHTETLVKIGRNLQTEMKREIEKWR